ncbi:hypothetical protein V2G26_000732 [Clonostachys chloroleuca]
MPGGASRCEETGACPTKRERKTREGASINAGKNGPYLMPRCFDGRQALGQWVNSAGTAWRSPFWKLLTRNKTSSTFNFDAAILGLELGQSPVHSPPCLEVVRDKHGFGNGHASRQLIPHLPEHHSQANATVTVTNHIISRTLLWRV